MLCLLKNVSSELNTKVTELCKENECLRSALGSGISGEIANLLKIGLLGTSITKK